VSNKTISDNLAFDVMPKPPRVPKRTIGRGPSKFELWAWSPVISFQVGLTAGYLAMIYFGISAIIAQIPEFRHTAPDGWSIWWAIALVIGGALASVGSVSRWRWFSLAELVGSTLITLTVGSYAAVLLFLAYVGHEVGQAAAGAGFVVLTVPVLVRMLWLASQSLRK